MDNFFDVNVTMLRMSGIWIPDTSSRPIIKMMYLLYNALWICYSCLFFCPSELVYFANTFTYVPDLVKNVNMGMTHFLANIKVCLWFYHRKEIMAIIETLGIYGRRYESYGDFDTEKIVQNAKRFKDIFSVLFLNFAMFTSISSCLICFLNVILADIPPGEEIDMKLPYFSYIPFNYKASKVAFSIAIWYQFFPVFNYAYIIVGGIWMPPQDSEFRIKLAYIAYNIPVLAFSCLLFCPSELVCFANTFSSLKDFIKNINMGMTHLLGNIKVCLFLYHRSEIMNIIKSLEIYGERYELYDQLDVAKITRKAKIYKDRFTVCFLLLGLFTGLSSSLSCLISVLQLQVSKGERIPLKLPYYSYMPFDYRSSKPAFVAGILYQFIPVINYAYIIIGFDTLYTAILGYVSAQLDIIQGAFVTIRPRCMVRLGLKLSQDILRDPPKLMDEMHKEMNKVMNHLQVLLNICRRLEEIFTNVILAQVMISLIVFCTCIFLVSNLPMMSLNFAAEMIYMIAIECQLLIYCVFGNKVTVSSGNISSSIYNGDWYSTSTSFKRSMLITMSRMQKPIYFTIGKFTPLTLSTFLTISRASYSFFAVLKNSDFSN